MAGASYGGLAATCAALRHPELFGNVLCQSGDFSWAPDHIHRMGQLADAMTETGWFAKEFIRSPKLPIRFHMDAGVFEVDQVGTGGNVLETHRLAGSRGDRPGEGAAHLLFDAGPEHLSGTLLDPAEEILARHI